jgi:HlyD family secretion protein
MKRLKEVYQQIVLLYRKLAPFFRQHKIDTKFAKSIQIGLVVTLVFSMAYLVWPKQEPISGYVEGDFVRISLPFSGQLQLLNVTEGDRINTGDILFKLDSREETSLYHQSVANMVAAKAQLNNLLTGKRPEELNVIKADLDAAKAQVELTQTIYERQKKLVQRRVTSQESLDKAETEYLRAKAQVKELESQLSVAKLPAREDEIKAARAKLEAAEADVHHSQWRLGQKTALAVEPGIVTNRLFVLGEFVGANMPVIEYLPDKAIKAVFFVKTTLVSRLTVGQNIMIETAHEQIPCKITFISPNAEYTPPVIYSNETSYKLVFRIEARPLDYNPKLHPGQPIRVIIP